MINFYIKHKTHFIVGFVLLLMGFLTYSNSLHSNFMMDDESFFDERMKNVKFLYYNFIPDKDQYLGINGRQRSLCYRPLNDAPVMILHLMFKDQPFGYHLVSLFLYCLASFIIYLFCFTVFKDFLLAILTSIFYLVHPINGVAVNHIVAIGFPLQVIFMTLSLLCFYLKIEDRRGKREEGRRAISFILHPFFFFFLPSSFFLLSSLFFFLLSLMCHETAAFLPLYILTFLFIVEKAKRKDVLLKSIPFFITLFVYLLFRLKFSSLTILMTHLPGTRLGFFNYIASLTKLISWYLSKLISPQGIVLTWVTPVVRENLLAWLIGFLSLLGFFIFLTVRYKKNNPSALLGLSWLFLGFLTISYASGISPKAELVMEPHWFIFRK